MNIHDVPIKPATLYIDKIQDKNIAYNLMADKGILVVGRCVASILKLCDGVRNISSIAKSLSLPCNKVVEIMKKLANYEILTLPGYRPTSSHKKESVLRIWVCANNTCNLSCRYCYVKKDGAKMSIETAHKLVDAVHRSIAMRKDTKFSLWYVLAGGEPLINLDVVKETLDYSQAQAEKFGLKRIASIVTNGTILNSKVIALIKKHNTGLGISVDGLGGMNRNRVFENGRPSIKVILRNIEKLLDTGVRPFIMVTLTPENLNGLKAFTKYLLERELGFSFSLIRDLSLKRHTDRLITILNECYDLMEKMIPNCSRSINHKFGSITLGSRIFEGCSLGERNLVISPEGGVYLCQMSIGIWPVITTIEDKDVLGRLWTQEALPELNEYKSIDSYEVCSLCRWRYQCAGACRFLTKMVTGHLNRPCPYCLVYQKIIPRLIRLKALNFIAEQARKLSSNKDAAKPVLN